jgi:beta-glucanase (GH16 family)
VRPSIIVRLRLRLLTISIVTALLAGCSSGTAAKTADYQRPSYSTGKLPARKLIWADNFNGTAGAPPDRAKWQPVSWPGGRGDDELEYYTPRASNVSLDGAGHLVITARRETYTGDGVTRYYTSARIETKGLFQTTYGELEARIKLPAGAGLWPAFWALGTDYDRVGWPSCGEIDMMEALGNDPFTVYGSLHGPSADSRNGYGMTTYAHSRVSLAAGFHVYGVIWSPSKIVFTLDGVPYAARDRASLRPGDRWVFNTPFYLILDLAVGGYWPGNPSASTRFPASMVVDWVRVYS